MAGYVTVSSNHRLVTNLLREDLNLKLQVLTVLQRAPCRLALGISILATRIPHFFTVQRYAAPLPRR